MAEQIIVENVIVTKFEDYGGAAKFEAALNRQRIAANAALNALDKYSNNVAKLNNAHIALTNAIASGNLKVDELKNASDALNKVDAQAVIQLRNLENAQIRYNNALAGGTQAANQFAAANRGIGQFSPIRSPQTYGYPQGATYYSGGTGGPPPPTYGVPGGYNMNQPSGSPQVLGAGAGNAASQAAGGLGRIGFQLLASVYVARQFAETIQEATERTLEFNRSVELMATQLGIATDNAAGFVVEAEILGVDVDTVTEAYRTFADRLGRATGLFGEANRGSKAMADAMADLGIQLYSADGRLRTMDDLIPEIADKFQELGPGIKTTALATALFGQRADELLPILIRGGDAFEKYKNFAKEAGLALTPHDIESLRLYQEQTKEIDLAFQGLLTTLGIGLSEGGYLSGVSGWIIDINQFFIQSQAVIFSWSKVFEAGFFDAITISQALWESISTGSSKAFEDAIKNQLTLRDALKISYENYLGFLAQRGFKPDTPGTGIEPLEGAGGTGITYAPGDEDGATAEKKQDILDRILKNQQNYYDDLLEMAIDFSVDQRRAEEDFSDERVRDVTDFNEKVRQAYVDFYREQDQRASDFQSEQSRRQTDFNRSQSDTYIDSQIDLRQRIDDYERGRLDDAEDYEKKRLRVIEDANRARLAEEDRTAEERLKLIDRHNKSVADLQAKWDEIILRLRIGGDRDSIEQARLAAEAALAEEQASNRAELDEFDQSQAEEQALEEEDTALKLARLEEDFRIEQERKARDFELDQARSQEEFDRDQERKQAEFELDMARRQADFDLEQNLRESEYQLEAERDREAFELKLQREDEQENLRATRDKEDYELRVAERTREFLSDLADLQKQYAELTMAVVAGQAGMTAAVAAGASSRIAIAQSEVTALASIYNSAGDDGLGGRPMTRRAFGGLVPGALGSPQLILAHGGEKIIPPASPQYFSNVRHGDSFADNRSFSFTANGVSNPRSIVNQLKQEIGRDALLRRANRGAN